MSKKNILEQEVDSLQNMSDLFYLLLQQTYRKEKTHWEEMKKEAEKELHVARKECEKLHKKKSSIFSSLKLSHSSTLHDTDMKIHHAMYVNTYEPDLCSTV
jgi:predicted XRE-type DNA-binding protein